MKLKIEEIKEEKEEEIIKEEIKEIKYFGKTKTELLKKYKDIFGMRKLFNKDVLYVKLNNNNYVYLDKDFNVICEYKFIYGMIKMFNKDVLDVELNNSNNAYLDKDLNIIIEFNQIEKVNDYCIITLNNKKYKVSEE